MNLLGCKRSITSYLLQWNSIHLYGLLSIKLMCSSTACYEAVGLVDNSEIGVDECVIIAFVVNNTTNEYD